MLNKAVMKLKGKINKTITKSMKTKAIKVNFTLPTIGKHPHVENV